MVGRGFQGLGWQSLDQFPGNGGFAFPEFDHFQDGLAFFFRKFRKVWQDPPIVAVINRSSGGIFQPETDRQVMRAPGEQVPGTDRVEQMLKLCPQAVCFPDGRMVVQMLPVGLGKCPFDRIIFGVYHAVERIE